MRNHIKSLVINCESKMSFEDLWTLSKQNMNKNPMWANEFHDKLLKSSRHFPIQPEVRLKPILPHSYLFSRALCQQNVFTSLNFDWFTELSVSYVTDWSEQYFWVWFYDTQLKTALTLRLANYINQEKRPTLYERYLCKPRAQSFINWQANKCKMK